jgi:hypothetical protein
MGTQTDRHCTAPPVDQVAEVAGGAGTGTIGVTAGATGTRAVAFQTAADRRPAEEIARAACDHNDREGFRGYWEWSFQRTIS